MWNPLYSEQCAVHLMYKAYIISVFKSISGHAYLMTLRNELNIQYLLYWWALNVAELEGFWMNHIVYSPITSSVFFDAMV